MSVVAERGADGTWVATDPDRPGIIGHGSTEAEARKSLDTEAFFRTSVLQTMGGGAAVPGKSLTFGRVYDALTDAGWVIKAKDRSHDANGVVICALLEKGAATFMANGHRKQIVSATWFDAICAATGLDPTVVTGP